MTRFEQELSGALGAYWKASAEKELDEIREELAAGRITIDAYGVARNEAEDENAENLPTLENLYQKTRKSHDAALCALAEFESREW